MSRRHLIASALLAALTLLFSQLAWAEKSEPHGGPAAAHGAAAEGGQGESHGADHGPAPINWYYGMLLETDTQEPNLLFRPKGMQPPLGAMILNAGILFFVMYRFGRRPLAEAVKKRKASIMHGMDEAGRMRDEAEDRLAGYEEKLESIDEEVERLKREMRAAGEAERARILAEAKERSQRMEREALILIEQELKAARQALVSEAVEGAVKSAAAHLAKEIGAADHARMADEYLAALDQAVITKGGQA